MATNKVRPVTYKSIANKSETEHIGSVGQTTFTASYNVGCVEVFINGFKLAHTEFTATDGENIVLNSPLIKESFINIASYSSFNVTDAVPTNRRINNYPLAGDITLDHSDVGALSLNGGTIAQDKYIDFAPNSSWGGGLRVGGNGYTASGVFASVVSTDGNLQLDAAEGHKTYLNHYKGDGIIFGDGAEGAITAEMDNAGQLWKGERDTGKRYHHNDAPEVKLYSFPVTISNPTDNVWTNFPGISLDCIPTGTYAISVTIYSSIYGGGQYSEKYSGICSWYEGDTNSSNADEILLHSAGHARNSHVFKMRTLRRARDTGGLVLQFYTTDNFTNLSTTVYFRRLI